MKTLSQFVINPHPVVWAHSYCYSSNKLKPTDLFLRPHPPPQPPPPPPPPPQPRHIHSLHPHHHWKPKSIRMSDQ
uniref:Uncharacterized protein n=1 Tax=Ditylenchus dipsaci TaxID=166011 RepID=A0A915D1N1_9BILA